MNTKQLKTIQSNFLHELQDACAGKKTSLRFIVHEISLSPIVKAGEVFQTFVIGGSVAKTATLRKKSANIKILDGRQYQVRFKTEQDFLSFVESKVAENINAVALNFAYPMIPVFENRRLDGELLAISKEGTFHGLIGKKIGQEIESYIFEKRKKRIKVSVANDTICLLLSGLTKYSFDNLAAGIVGTGLNFAFFLAKNRLVNLESASFDKFPQSPEGITVDRQSLLPGRGLFEKETAGAYLYKHFNIIIKNKKIDFPPVGSTEELNNISLKQIPQVSETAQGLLKRSAQLVACQIAGIIEFKKDRHSGDPSADGDSRISNHDKRLWTSPSAVSSGQPNCQNDKTAKGMTFNMEGSLFWKANGYKETVIQTVKQLAPEYKVTFVEIKDSGILGAAKLVS